jgi:4-amino-4-deoxy-L-arabinose transferase-like glycosyltransferase
MLIPARSGAAAGGRKEVLARLSQIQVQTWLLAGVTVLAAILRLTTLSSQSFWLDEAQAVHEVHLSFGGMLSAWSATEWNPPLYLLIAWPWARVFGTSEAGLRSLSALLGTAVVPITYLCGRELVSRRAGLAAAALAALSPFMIWYSQEAREYMLLAALSGMSLLFFARTWRRPSRRNLVWWTVFSGLALLTQYFAAFLIAAEAIGLLYRTRDRRMAVAIAVLATLEVALIPHVVSHIVNPAQFIVGVPLSLRLQQVPVTFGLNTLYLSPIVSYGLLGAAVLAIALIVLLVIGSQPNELRGAGLAALMAAAVVLVPLVLALVGPDDYLARALMPGWIPLVVVIGAACTARGARRAGAVLFVLLAAMFVYAGVRIDGDPQYQRKPWSRIADALGKSSVPRAVAVLADDGEFAAGPLSIYLPRIAWAGPGEKLNESPAVVTVSELDIVGTTYQTLADPLPGVVKPIGSGSVDGYDVYRFRLAHPLRLSRAQLGQQALGLLGPASPGPVVMIQPPAST